MIFSIILFLKANIMSYRVPLNTNVSENLPDTQAIIKDIARLLGVNDDTLNSIAPFIVTEVQLHGDLPGTVNQELTWLIDGLLNFNQS